MAAREENKGHSSILFSDNILFSPLTSWSLCFLIFHSFFCTYICTLNFLFKIYKGDRRKGAKLGLKVKFQ